MAEKAMMVDISRCMGCRGCQVACKQWNRLQAETTSFTGIYQNPPNLSPKTWRYVRFFESVRDEMMRWQFLTFACLHCKDAACVKVCPAPGALTRQEEGFVYLDEGKCIGCKYCVEACPFGVPRFDDARGKVYKCNFCSDRVVNGLPTACAQTCPAGAITFGDRNELITRARTTGHTYIYGEKELDGLNVMYLLPETPNTYGLPVSPQMPASVVVWKDVIKPLGLLAGGGTLLALLIHYLAIGPKRAEGGE